MRRPTERNRSILFANALCAALLTLVLLAPEGRTSEKREVFVATANPHATEAGLDVLKRGGGAVDAAVAVQAMLGLVEPQSSGVGGGGFLMHYDAQTGRVTAYSGRERAPAQGVGADMFLQPDGTMLPRGQAMLTGRASGVPGVVSMLKMAHDRHGRRPWRSLFSQSIDLAERGFPMTPRLAKYVHGSYPQSSAPDVRRYFTGADGALLNAGDIVKNRDYARFLRKLASRGPSALYRGETARKIVARVAAEPLGGSMTLADLEAYNAEEIEALCRPYRVYVLCAPAPPASGVGLLHLMGLLSRTDIAARGPDDPQAWFLFAEASRLMYADRDKYLGDPKFVTPPVAGLLDPAYLDARAALIEAATAPPMRRHGQPPGAPASGEDRTDEAPGTTHFVIVDAEGDVVSMTSTVESYFGSGRIVDGFFLNNELTDFDLRPQDADGAPAANAVAPGKRPRSSMTPVIILSADNRFVGAIGSPGGNAIPAYVAKTLVGLLDWNLRMQSAIDLPNLVARGASFNGEAHRFAPGVAEALRARGIEVKRGSGEESGLHGVILREGRFDGGADPRREGVAATALVSADR